MPIIEMKKVFLLGHRQERDSIFNLLHKLGSVHLLDMKSGDAWNEFEALLEPDQPDEAAAQVDARLSDIRYCLDFFQRHFPVRKNFVQQFTGAKLELTPKKYSGYINSLDLVRSTYSSCRKADDDLARIRNEESQFNNLIEELTPWVALDLPLEQIRNGSFVSMDLYTVIPENIATLTGSLEENLSAHHLEVIFTDKEFVYFFFTGLVAELETVQNLFKEKAVTRSAFTALTGTAAENIESLHQKLESVIEERAAVLKEIELLLEHRPMLMACHDHMDNELMKHEAVSNLARTENSFLLEGWVPVPVLDDLEMTIAEKTDTAVLAVRDPRPGEDVPVLLHNSGPIEAYEVVTKLYSTPRKSEIDPTPFMAPFFFVFFGICLSDAGYGVILALLALFVSRKLKLAGMGKQLLNLLFLGGLSAIFFGVLLGSYFGDLIGLPALWFDPLEDPMRMLFYCFGIGLIHVYFGMALQAYRNFKAGHLLSAIFDQGFWFIFLNGLILLLLPEFSAFGRLLAIGGAAGLILTQGRTQQGIVKKFMSGLLSLYNITGYLSDVLSYSRLLALGLATGVIASAINSMGGMVAGGFVGTAIMVIVLFGGHLFNIVISTLGSYVHTSRLQYIEFFGKFFEGGGQAFNPFTVKTSYVDVIETEKAL
ncbi:MAG: V-type ATP synthase subunit I [Clostridia bacterium]|nr:V-type ATP synthase subunit I [Clostridia bacterium]